MVWLDMLDREDELTRDWFLNSDFLQELKSLHRDVGMLFWSGEDVKTHIATLLDNSRPLEPNLVAKEEATKGVAAYFRRIFKQNGFEFTKRIDPQLLCLLVNLYWRYCYDPMQWTGLKLRNVEAVPARYNLCGVSPKTMSRFRDALKAAKLVYTVKGFQDDVRKRSRSPKILATPDLIKILEDEFGWKPDIVRFHPDTETIEMKSHKSRKGYRVRVDYEDTADVVKQRKLLQDYNLFLSEQQILLPKPDGYFRDLILTRRIFNNRSWSSSGRLFGGEFQQLAEEKRSEILVNKEPIRELDIKSCHATMAFAEAGIDWYRSSNQDIYQHAGLESWPREIAKHAFNIMLNSGSPAKAEKSLLYWRSTDTVFEDIGFDPPKGWAGLLIAAITETFPELEKVFYSKPANRFMNIEGSICMAMIEWGMKADIPILTIHDSFICPQSHADQMRKEIIRQFEEKVGVACIVE